MLDKIVNINILNNRKVALFSSERCPASLIMVAQDMAYRLNDAGITVIQGGHSPVEKECLRVLLKGSQPIIICPARSMEKMRIPKVWKEHIESGRLQIVSPFKNQHRVTANLAWERNLFMADLADEIIIIHASPDSKTMKLVNTIKTLGKQIYTVDDPANEPLLKMGVKALNLSEVK